MRKFALLLTTALATNILFAQDENDLGISFSSGWMSSTHYQTPRARSYYNVDFDYQLASRHVLSSSFNAGKHNYFDNVLSNVPAHPETPTNAEAGYLSFSILYKYRVIDGKKFTANLGAGAGIMNHVREYQYWEPNRGDVRQSASTGVVFPLRLDLSCRLSNRLAWGVLGGAFIQPDQSGFAYHLGPRLTYVLK